MIHHHNDDESNIISNTFSLMSTVGETLFDRSSDNHDEIWDDTELIRAYDRAHRHIQNRLRPHAAKTKKDSSKNKNYQSHNKSQTKKEDAIPSTTTTLASCPTPVPLDMITPPQTEQDAFHSMLMSWYMAGYHAGQLAAKNRQKNS